MIDFFNLFLRAASQIASKMPVQGKTVCAILGVATAVVALGVGGYFLWKKYPWNKEVKAEETETPAEKKPEEETKEE